MSNYSCKNIQVHKMCGIVSAILACFYWHVDKLGNILFPEWWGQKKSFVR
jgi:hypothetical protein